MYTSKINLKIRNHIITTSLILIIFCAIFAGLSADAQIVIGGGSTVADHIIDQTSKTDTSGTPYYLSPFMTGSNSGHNATSIAFSFNADGEYLAYIGVMIAKVGGAGVVWTIQNHPYLYVSIYDNDPNSNQPNNWIADSDQLSWTNLLFTNRMQEMNFTLSSLPRLTEGQVYWAVLNSGGNAVWHTDMYVTVSAPTPTPPANNGITLTQPVSSGTWNTITPNQGICFTAYGIITQPDIIDQILEPDTIAQTVFHPLSYTGAGANSYQSISFVGNGDYVTQADIAIGMPFVAVADQYFQCFIFLADANKVPSGNYLSQSDKLYAVDYDAGTWADLTFTFDGTYQTINGSNYCLVVVHFATSTYNSNMDAYLLTTSDLSGVHGNIFLWSATGAVSSWTITSTATLPFTVYGTFSLITVTYTANFPSDAQNVSGSAPNDHFFYNIGDVVAVAANPFNLTANNYIFMGWAYVYNSMVPDYVVTDLNTVVPDSFVAGDSNIMLYGVWSSVVQSFATVIFRQYDLQGGTINHDIDTPYLFEVGTFEFLTGAPAVNYKFMGWLQNGTLMSESQSYNFYIASEDTYVVTAIFYDPLSKGSLEDLDLMAVLAIALCAILIAFVLFAILWVRGRRRYEEGEA